MLQIEMMAYSDHMIYEVLKEVLLTNPKPTYELISSKLPVRCERTTIWRALKRLEAQNMIRRTGQGGRLGYTYELLEDVAV